jgi:hypothetical protein
MAMSFSAITTVVSAASSRDMTDLATAKTELSIALTANDAWISKAITQVSRAVQTYLKRTLVPEVVQDLLDFQSQPFRQRHSLNLPELQLSRWPVISIVSVSQLQSDMTALSLVEGTDFRVNYETGTLLRLNTSGQSALWETLPLTVNYMAGYGAKVTEVQSVPATPYKVTVAQSAAFSCDQSVSYANGTKLTRVSASPIAGQYSVTAGVYTFAAADLAQTLTFVYGVKALPEDLIEVCLRLINARYRAKDRDPALVQLETPGVGSQRFWVGRTPGQSSAFPPDIEHMLDEYIMPVVA